MSHIVEALYFGTETDFMPKTRLKCVHALRKYHEDRHRFRTLCGSDSRSLNAGERYISADKIFAHVTRVGQYATLVHLADDVRALKPVNAYVTWK